MRSRWWTMVCVAFLAVPSPTQRDLPTPSACRALLAALDEAWNSGDADVYLRLFAAEQPLLHELHGRTVREQLGHHLCLVRTSELGRARRVGPRVVLPVRYRTHVAEATPTAAHPEELSTQGVVVARTEGDQLVPVLAIDLPAHTRDSDTALTEFACPACNYHLGPAEGWLCVPIARDRTAAVEAATFLLLGTDIALDLSVQLGDRAEPAQHTVADLADRMRTLLPDAVLSTVAAWTPPGVTTPVDALSSARATLDFPDGQRTVLHAVALGRLRHLLLLRGSPSALQAHAQAVAELLATYRLLQTDARMAQQAAQSLSHHTGGALVGTTYHNERHRLVVDGPNGWHAVQRCGGSLFQVVWTCPHGTGRMWLSGYGPPEGCAAWTTDLADLWLQELARHGELRQLGAADSGWSAAADHQLRVRSLVVPPSRTAPVGSAHACERHLQLWLREDLLVLADGYTSDPEQAAEVRRAVRSLQAR